MSGDANEWHGNCPTCGKELVVKRDPRASCPDGHTLEAASDRHLQSMIAGDVRAMLLAVTELTAILVDVRRIALQVLEVEHILTRGGS